MMASILVLILLSGGADDDCTRAGFNGPAWEAALSVCEGMDADRIRFLLTELPVKDLFEAESLCILNHIQGVRTDLIPGYSIPEDSLRKYVLWPTVAHWDHMEDWRPILRERFIALAGDDCDATVRRMKDWFHSSITVQDRKDLFGAPSPPVATLKRGWGSPMETAGLFVAGLRSLGIAARLGSGSTEVHYFDGATWQIAIAFDAGSTTSKEIPGEIALPGATLVLTLTRGGEPYLKEEAVGMARWKEGKWEPVMSHVLPVEFSTTDSTIVIRTVPGTYLVTAGIRNARGEPRIWRATVELYPDRETTLDIALDIPFGELRTDDLIRGNVPEFKDITIFTPSNRERNLLSFIGQYPVLFVLVTDGAETSERFLKDLAERETMFREKGLQTVIIGSDSSSMQKYSDSCGMLAGALGLVKNSRIVQSRLPVILLFDDSSRLILKQEGYSSIYVDLIEYVLDVDR